MGLDANWRLGNAKSSSVHENNPGVACVDEIEKTERKCSVQANSSRITPANLLCECFYVVCARDILVGRADFDSLVLFENTASCISTRHAINSSSNSVCCLRCRAPIGAQNTRFVACAG